MSSDRHPLVAILPEASTYIENINDNDAAQIIQAKEAYISSIKLATYNAIEHIMLNSSLTNEQKQALMKSVDIHMEKPKTFHGGAEETPNMTFKAIGNYLSSCWKYRA